MKRLFSILAAALLTGCVTIPGVPEATGIVASAVDAFSGPDTDYTNFLKQCRNEVTAQKEVAIAENKALEAGINSTNKEIQVGSLVLLAAKSGQSGPRIGCTVDRKPGLAELAFGKGDVLDKGLRLYEINRDNKRFKQQLAADQEMFSERLKHERGMADRQNLLINTLTGNEERLRGQRYGFEIDRRQLEQQAPPPAQ